MPTVTRRGYQVRSAKPYNLFLKTKNNMDKKEIEKLNLHDIVYALTEAEMNGWLSRTEVRQEFQEVLRLVKNYLISLANNK